MDSSINSRALCLAIRSAWGAVSKDSTRPHLASVQIVASEGTVAVNATDGHRLHRVTFAGGGNFSRLFHIAKKVGKNATAEVSDDGSVLTLTDGASVTTIAAHDASMIFPQVTQVIPKPRGAACAGPVGVNSQYVSSACESAALVASPKTGGVRLLIGAAALDPVQIDADSVEFAPLNLSFKAIVMPMRF